MTEEQLIFSRQLSANPAFKWDLGMLAVFEDTTVRDPLFLTHPADIRFVEGRAYPDLSDPSTVGVLLHFLTEEGIQKIVHSAPTKENFSCIVARTLLEELG
jgi:hypothetical protein